jgi:predicted transcriptional regulator
VPREVKKTAYDGTVATSVRLPARLRARLQAIADEERRTLGNVIRIAIEDWLTMRDVKKGAGK